MRQAVGNFKISRAVCSEVNSACIRYYTTRRLIRDLLSNTPNFMSVRENFADIYLRGMPDRSKRSGTELAREIQLTDWSTAGNLSNRSSGVQILRDICTRFRRYLYCTKCSWIIKLCLLLPVRDLMRTHYM